MVVAIVGSREHPEWEEAVREYVRRLPDGTVVISGACYDDKSPDRWAIDEADKRGLETYEYPPKPGPGVSYRAACYARNVLIADACDRLVAFWDGRSTGTNHARRCARQLGKPVETIRL